MDTPEMDTPTSVPTRTANVALKVGGRHVELRLDVPAAPVEPVALLPLFRSLTDTLVDIAADEARSRGLSVSCRKGCGACCRQLVPISEMEVVAIRRLIAALPEPRRSGVIERFERAIARFAEAHMAHTLRHPESLTAEQLVSFALAYFRQGVACPFLEDESCSIHPERPLACREYLVTSRPENCAHPSPDGVRCVDMPAKVSRAVRGIESDEPREFRSWVPMVLALEWPLPSEPPTQPGTTMLTKAFERLTGAKIPEA